MGTARHFELRLSYAVNSVSIRNIAVVGRKPLAGKFRPWRHGAERIWHAMDAIGEIYTEVSAKNLNPPSLLFVLTSPLTITTTSALPVSRALAYSGLVLFLLLALIPLACLLHAYFAEQVVGTEKKGEKVAEVVRSVSAHA